MDQKTFVKYIDCHILSVEKIDEYCEVKVGLKNKSEKIVRLINLSENKVLQLKDKEGYVSYSLGTAVDITIPEKSGIKTTFEFSMEGISSKLRLYGVEFEIDKSEINHKMEKKHIPQ